MSEPELPFGTVYYDLIKKARSLVKTLESNFEEISAALKPLGDPPQGCPSGPAYALFILRHIQERLDEVNGMAKTVEAAIRREK